MFRGNNLFSKFAAHANLEPASVKGSGKKNILLRQTTIYGFQGRTSCPRLSLPPGRDALQTINRGLPEQNILFAGT